MVDDDSKWQADYSSKGAEYNLWWVALLIGVIPWSIVWYLHAKHKEVKPPDPPASAASQPQK